LFDTINLSLLKFWLPWLRSHGQKSVTNIRLSKYTTFREYSRSLTICKTKWLWKHVWCAYTAAGMQRVYGVTRTYNYYDLCTFENDKLCTYRGTHKVHEVVVKCILSHSYTWFTGKRIIKICSSTECPRKMGTLCYNSVTYITQYHLQDIDDPIVWFHVPQTEFKNMYKVLSSMGNRTHEYTKTTLYDDWKNYKIQISEVKFRLQIQTMSSLLLSFTNEIICLWYLRSSARYTWNAYRWLSHMITKSFEGKVYRNIIISIRRVVHHTI